MTDLRDLSVSEARDVVVRISRGRGWVEPDLQATTHPSVLETLAQLRREFGDVVETYVFSIFVTNICFIAHLF